MVAENLRDGWGGMRREQRKGKAEEKAESEGTKVHDQEAVE